MLIDNCTCYMLSKRTSILFIIVNSLYIIYFIVLMIWLKQPVITDVTKQPVILSNQVLAVIQIIMSLLSLLIFIGLACVLAACKEKWWIITAVCFYLLLQLYFNMLSVLSIYRLPLPYVFYNYTVYVNYTLILFMVISLLFIQAKSVKNYYRWFGITLLLSLILVRVTPVLYDNYSLTWALINPGVLKIIPFFVSLFLFMKLFRIGRA